ncbi:YdcF family protein [Caminibacter mediatlanticus TB-2]|uniref:YdcF family protein n=1 Tax=Caminibacter mediatlanticus TB-2 TaxID=391592 RepID=A0AAI9AHU6_9BACT|nr:ElyC/SanA/YdcF family protein [Caminibacter mediatlanticus]EDM23875.1 hypothetical protein CMTB2_06466 [Caminibacter mediatlanticus TB-2]QCT94243.1 YdcF family protein [Caminibacter mediatlanticus TB-2]
MFYIISKLFTYLFLPPGIFIIILLIATIFAKRFKILFFISALTLYLLSIQPVSNMLLNPLENFKHKDNITPSAVVVLGGGSNPKDTIKAFPDAFKREVYGLILAKTYNIPFVFSGGGIGKISEAENTKHDVQLLTKTFDVNITTYFEDKSLNTIQNGMYTALLFKKLKLPKNIYLVTNAYHMKRSYKIFKFFGFKIITKPVGFYSKPIESIWDYFPKMNSLNASYKAIHEYFGLLSLKIKGI